MSLRQNYTAMHNDPYIHTRDPRTIERSFHRHCTSDLHETRELEKGEAKSYLARPRDLSRHIILGIVSPGGMIMKTPYGVYRNMPPFRPV